MEAFTYMFKDNKFMNKAGLYFIFIVLSKLISFNTKFYAESVISTIFNFVLGCLVACITAGYSVHVVKSLIDQRSDFLLPYINLKNDIVLGIKFYLANFLLNIIIFALSFLVVIPYFLLNIFPGKFNDITMLCMSLILLIVVLFLMLCLMILMPSMTWRFAQTRSLLSYVNFKQALISILKDKVRYFKSVGILALIFIVFIACAFLYKFFMTSFLPCNNINNFNILKSIIICAIGTYFFYVINFIIAKSITDEYKEIV